MVPMGERGEFILMAQNLQLLLATIHTQMVITGVMQGLQVSIGK